MTMRQGTIDDATLISAPIPTTARAMPRAMGILRTCLCTKWSMRWGILRVLLMIRMLC